jgi:hypothetical protein
MPLTEQASEQDDSPGIAADADSGRRQTVRYGQKSDGDEGHGRTERASPVHVLGRIRAVLRTTSHRKCRRPIQTIILRNKQPTERNKREKN